MPKTVKKKSINKLNKTKKSLKLASNQLIMQQKCERLIASGYKIF